MIAGETLLVPVRGGVGDLASIFSFNAVGTTIWQALAKPASREALVDLIESEYDAPRSAIEQDVTQFLSDMRLAGLVTTTSPLESRHIADVPRAS